MSNNEKHKKTGDSLLDLVAAVNQRGRIIRTGIACGDLRDTNHIRVYQLMWERLEHELQRRTVVFLNDGCSLVVAQHLATRCKRAGERAREACERYRDERARHNAYVRDRIATISEDDTTIN